MSLTVDILDRLVAFPTVSTAPNLDLIDYAQAFLGERGFAVHRLPDGSGRKAGLYATIGPAGRGVLLSAHTDVVPVEGQEWQRQPFRLSREGPRLYGRGTTDMKGFVASVLALADRAASADLAEPLKIALSYDEEVGCVGIERMIGPLQGLIGSPRACLVGEPTEMTVAIGHKGKAAFTACCHGQGGHSALAPRFVNALHLATDFVTALRRLQDDLARTGRRDTAYEIPHATLHVGLLSGGLALNMVPDRATVDFELRHLAREDPDALRARIEEAADAVAAPYRKRQPTARIEISRHTAYPGLEVDVTAPVVRLFKGLSGVPGTTKVPFGTEAGYFAALGIPTIVCGPGCMQAQGHQPDEYVTIDQLAACDTMLSRLLETLSR